MSDPIVGIDLGTSNTVVAHADADGMAVILADANGFKIHPSVVSFHPSGGVVVGAAAKQRKVIDPKNTIYSVKRLIGRSFNSHEVQTATKRAPYQIKEGANQLPLIVTRGGEFAVPEISAIVLDHAKNVATSALKTDVSRAVVTVPASFNDAQRSATATAGSIAGLTVVRVLNEPTAAALAYGHTRNLKQTIAVYDFGGGTFDITILKLEDQVYEVLGTSGDSFLGGDDLDERIVDRMVDAFLAEHRVDLRTNEVSMMRLRAVAEQTKIELSRRSRAVVRVDEIAYGPKGKALDLQIEIRRDDFVSQVADIIDRTFPVCEEAMKLAGLGIGQIDDVILVGGTTKIPYVRDLVTTFFNRAPRTDVSPEDAVAMGAALQATALERMLSHKSPSQVAVPASATFDELDDAFGTLDSETHTFARDELERTDPTAQPQRQTLQRPSYERLPARPPTTTERAVQRGTHHDIFEDMTPPPVSPSAPPGAPVIGRLTKQITPVAGAAVARTTATGVPVGSRTVVGMTAPTPPPAPRGARPPTGPVPRGQAAPPPTPRTAPRVAERPPLTGAMPTASPQSRTMIAQQPSIIIEDDPSDTLQSMTTPATTARGFGAVAQPPATAVHEVAPRDDSHLDLEDDFGFPNLTTEKGFVDLDALPPTTGRGYLDLEVSPSATAKGMSTSPSTAKATSTSPPPASDDVLDFELPPSSTAKVSSYPARSTSPSQSPLARSASPSQSPASPRSGSSSQPPPLSSRSGSSSQPSPLARTMIVEPPVVAAQARTMIVEPPVVAAQARTMIVEPPVVAAQARTMIVEQPPGARAAAPAPAWNQPAPAPAWNQPAPAPAWNQPAAPTPGRTAGARSPVVLDVTPRGLGIATVAGFCEELIRRNSRVPSEMRKVFVTSRDNQDAVRIIVAQGESRKLANNTVIADLRLDGLTRRPRGETSIEVTFLIDANGILQVSARDTQTGRDTRATLDIIGTLPEGDVTASRERLQSLRRE